MPEETADRREKCPDCRGTGCDPEPLRAPADGTTFLFPRCALCNGKGDITREQYERWLSRRLPANSRSRED